ncbi:sulfur relay (sulfurtransferase) DsrF/TusC family protein [Pedobacter sp. UYEF25]
MKFKKSFFFFVLVGMVSCKKELINSIQFRSPSQQYDLVVEGGVNALDSNQFIKLSKPVFQVSDSIVPINDAQIFINDVALHITNDQGIYSTNLLNNKNYNSVYKLRIEFGNKTYYAEDSLKQVAPIEPSELNMRKQQVDESTFLSIPKHVFNSPKPAIFFYQLAGQKDWSAAFFGPSTLNLFIHSAPPPYGLSPVLEKRTNHPYNEADMITVYKFSVSNAYEKFLYQTFQETDWKSLFSSTPGSIKGNISGNALGFFSCSDGIIQKFSVKTLTK